MKYLKYLLLVLITSYLGAGQPLNAQTLQGHNNSISVQMGLFHYNKDNNDFITQNNNGFLNAGLTYKRQMGRILALNLTGRYYEWEMGKYVDLQTKAVQALLVVQPHSISSSWRTNWITPYVGAGVGYENHKLTSYGNDTTYQKLYIPIEVGLLFNLSTRVSIGVFSEYKLASVSPIKNTLESPKVRLDLVNTAGISLAYSFGRNKKKESFPVIRTNQSLVQKPVVKEVVKDSTLVSPAKTAVKDSTAIVLEGKVKDSTLISLDERAMDSTAVFTGENLADSTMVLAEEKVKDSTMVWTDPMLADSLMVSDSSDRIQLVIPVTDSAAIGGKSKVLTRKTVIVSDTIRVPVILDITVNAKSGISDTNYSTGNTAGMQQPEKGAASSPAPVYYEAPNQQMQGQLGKIDNNVSDLQEQYRRQNSTIETELKNMKLMLGVMNAELLILTAAKSKAPKEEKKIENSPPAPAVNMDSLTYLIQRINSQSGTDSVSLSLANANVSLLAELNKLQAENKALSDKLDGISRVEPTPAPVPDLPYDVVHAITFAVNSTKVDVVQLIPLRSMLDFLKSKPDYKLLLAGFTDKSGNATYNMALSKKRVQAVKDELVKMGVNKARIVEQYFGSEKASAANNENDRKVELKVLKN